MINIVKLHLGFALVVLLVSCSVSMSPMAVNNTLPSLTKSIYLTQKQAEESIKSNQCKYLVKGRKYTAPLGSTAKGDLKNGAKGIDEWVKLDGGNAYVLVNFEWIIVDQDGSTQLHLEFDTMLCE
jgi:hypothetical protein